MFIEASTGFSIKLSRLDILEIEFLDLAHKTEMSESNLFSIILESLDV